MYYKLVICKGCREPRYSLTEYDKSLSLQYSPGEWVEPKISGSLIFVFDTLENAYEYYKSLPRRPIINSLYAEIWECECLNPIPFQPLTYLYDIPFFWNSDEKTRGKYKREKIKGSVGAEAIKITRMLEIGEVIHRLTSKLKGE
jgi:hypothetical protein